MTKPFQMICEAKLNLAKTAGAIEARVTSWGAREGADGRRFNYQPEGFMDWQKEFADSGRPLPMFVNHSADAIPVGEWTAFEFDDTGMTATGRMFVNTTQGSDLYKIMKDSPTLFGGVSVAAYADEYAMVDANGDPALADDEEAYFQIAKGGLREVSVVMYPNNPVAEVSRLEYFLPDGSADLRVLEESLRDAGVSKQAAVTAASVFKKVLEQRDAVPAPIEPAPIQRDSEAEVTEILAALNEREILKNLNQRLKANHV